MGKVVSLRPGSGTSPELTAERARIAQLLGVLFRRARDSWPYGHDVRISFKTAAEATEFFRLLNAIPRRARPRK